MELHPIPVLANLLGIHTGSLRRHLMADGIGDGAKRAALKLLLATLSAGDRAAVEAVIISLSPPAAAPALE